MSGPSSRSTRPASPDRGVAQVDEFLAAVQQPHRDTLIALRSTLRRVLPTATECLKYSMPCFVVEGKGVAGYAAFKQHCSYFPMSGGVLTAAGDALKGYDTTSGSLHFAIDRPLPVGLVRRLVRLRLDEISHVTDGRRLEFFDDGTVKARGSMKAGALHGAWKWYRADGSLMRTGRFDRGEQVGRWETWAADGTLVTATQY